MIYKFKMTTGRKDGFYREYELKLSDTLYDFHRHIQNDLDFDDAQMAAFYTSNANWEEHKQYALFDMGNGAMDTILLESLITENIKYLVYTFDFYNNRSFLIEFIGETEPERREHYPRTSDGKGNPPDQLIDRPVNEPLPLDDLLVKSEPKKEVAIDDEDSIDEEDFDDNDEDNDEEVLDDSDLEMLSETQEL